MKIHAIFSMLLFTFVLGHTSLAETTPPAQQPVTIKNISCMVMAMKADNSGMDIIYQAPFAWDTQSQTTQLFHQEGKLSYLIYSEAKSGIISFVIANTETRTLSSALGDLNKVLLVLDSSSQRAFGCGIN